MCDGWWVDVSLDTLPAYDTGTIGQRRGQAVVLGAGVAGLLAARVLADAYDRVVVLERDSLPTDPTPRAGVPQDTQLHVLLDGGRRAIEQYCPGVSDAFVAAGGVRATGAEIAIYVEGGRLWPTDRHALTFATRPLFEQVIRDHVTACDDVTIREECRFVSYQHDPEAAVVDGVSYRDPTGDLVELAAALVVDATGRASRTPAWLARHGDAAPPLETCAIDIGYATLTLERPPDDRRAISLEAEPPHSRGAFVLPVEGDRWLWNVHGVHGDHPPTDPEGLTAFAERLPEPVVAEILATHDRTGTPVERYRFPSNRRYRYEDCNRLPTGLVVVGDAIASFNPVNGQGMTVAALEALALHHVLADGDDAVADRFFDAAAPIVDVAWELTISSDLAFPATDGERSRRAQLGDRYVSRVIRRAHTDPWLSDLVWTVFTMERHPSILARPRVAWRALKPTWSGDEHEPSPDARPQPDSS